LTAKYRRPRHNLRTLAFLRFSHIGGVDTLLYSLANGSCLVVIDDRSPDAVCQAIARHRVEVLPTAPSFLNLLALDGAWQRHDLSSLKFVTYGAEVMPQATLDRVVEMFPGVQLLQKYGTTEVGTLRSQSRAPGSRWVRLGGEGYQLRVVDGLLQIKAESAMLGYLNAPSPIDADGWFHTGDLAEVDGDYLLINGRATDVINVGGRKVNPAEVESALLRIDNVADATVYGEPNAFLGQIVCARVQPAHDEPADALRARIREQCGQFLDSYKVPAKIVFGSGEAASDRFKKIRSAI
jgi:acyl-coenzyme A synthetase/AMP-(fatty) acid ligase